MFVGFYTAYPGVQEVVDRLLDLDEILVEHLELGLQLSFVHGLVGHLLVGSAKFLLQEWQSPHQTAHLVCHALQGRGQRALVVLQLHHARGHLKHAQGTGSIDTVVALAFCSVQLGST